MEKIKIFSNKFKFEIDLCIYVNNIDKNECVNILYFIEYFDIINYLQKLNNNSIIIIRTKL
jgi:hypothetical protein